MAFTPYGTSLTQNEVGHTAKNWSKLTSGDYSYPFTVGVIPDTHFYYKDFNTVVQNLNQSSDIDLVVHLGDMTNNGLRSEYRHALEILQKVQAPWLTIIGNHDALTYGKDIYFNMFGPYNYYIDVVDFRLIFFNNNDLEFNNTGLDYKWLQNVLSSGSDKDHRIVFAHISVTVDRNLRAEMTERLDKMMNDHNVIISLHGHTNTLYARDDDGTDHIGIGHIETGKYGILKIYENYITLDQHFGKGRWKSFRIDY